MSKKRKETILVVDDAPGSLEIMADILSPDYDIMVAKSGGKALEIVRSFPGLDLILLDVVMPELDGYATCCLLKSDPRTRNIPIIFVSSQIEAFDVARGLEVGGVDYLTKPVNRLIVRARVKAHLALSLTTRMLTHELGVHQVELELQDKELRRAYKDLEESRASLPQRLILAQEKERSRISQEIHSDFGQSLLALKMFICMSASKLHEDNLQVKSAFEEAKKQLSHIIDKVRKLSHELAPPSLQYIGLVDTIRILTESSRCDKKLKIHFFHRNMNGVTFGTKDIIIFRIVQEAIHNIFKHSEATEAWIKVLCQNSVFSLEIRDNGKGFDPENLSKSRGLGLDLMKEQALLIQGDLSMKSQIGKGTTLNITFPIH